MTQILQTASFDSTAYVAAVAPVYARLLKRQNLYRQFDGAVTEAVAGVGRISKELQDFRAAGMEALLTEANKRALAQQFCGWQQQLPVKQMLLEESGRHERYRLLEPSLPQQRDPQATALLARFVLLKDFEPMVQGLRGFAENKVVEREALRTQRLPRRRGQPSASQSSLRVACMEVGDGLGLATHLLVSMTQTDKEALKRPADFFPFRHGIRHPPPLQRG